MPDNHQFLCAKQLLRPVMVLAAALALASCAPPREAHPIAISQPDDDQLSCEAIDREIAENKIEALRIAKVDTDVKEKNRALSIASWFGTGAHHIIDLSRVEEIQIRALKDRNQNLQRLNRKKQCLVS